MLVFVRAAMLLTMGIGVLASGPVLADNLARVSGIVVDRSTNEPLTGVTVVAIRVAGSIFPPTETQTDSAGNYSLEFSLSEPTDIVIEAAGPDHAPRRYGTEIELDCAFGCASDRSSGAISIEPAANLTNSKLELTRTGGRVKGSIRKAESGEGLAGTVRVYGLSGAESVKPFSNHFWAQSNEDGLYEMPLALPARELRLAAEAINDNRVAQAWEGFDCQLLSCLLFETTPVIIQTGTVMPGFNFSLRAGASISGRADLPPDGPPTSGRLRYALLHDGAGKNLSFNPLSYQYGFGDEWQIDGLAGGSYYIIFGTPGGAPPPYLRQSHNGTICTASYESCAGIGPPITLPQGASLSGVDHQYTLGGGILVRLIDADTGGPAVPNENWSKGFPNMDILDSSGERVMYTPSPYLNDEGHVVARSLAGMPPGQYFVRTYSEFDGRGLGQVDASENLGSTIYMDAMYPDVVCAGAVCDYDQAETVSVVKGETTEITIELSRGHSIYGTVNDAETGQPLAGILVTLVDADNVRLAATFSSADGSYRLGAFPAGDYYLRTSAAGRRGLRFSISPKAYFDRVYGAVGSCSEELCDPRSGTAVQLSGNGDAGPFPIEIQPGPVIKGRLVDQLTGLTISRGRVDVFDEDDRFVGRFFVNRSTHHFQTVALNPGLYRLEPAVSPAFSVVSSSKAPRAQRGSSFSTEAGRSGTAFFIEIGTESVERDFGVLDKGIPPDEIFADDFLAHFISNQWLKPTWETFRE